MGGERRFLTGPGSYLDYYPLGVYDLLVRLGSHRSGAVNSDAKKKLQARLNRIAGQIGGVQRMVEEDRYCVDILTQVAAVRSALDAMGVELLTDHIQGCVVGQGTGSEHHCAKEMTQEALVEEVRVSLGRFLK